jgi:CBS domain containing-hemolysin-like protein
LRTSSCPARASSTGRSSHGHSRLPVFRIDLDHTEGFVHAKDLLRAIQQGAGSLRDVMRPPHFAPDSKRVAELLREMQRLRFHMALVIDEYGSVSGLVTLEDVLEELVGDIADEHDWQEPEVVRLDDGRYRVHGTLSIDELNALLDVELPKEEWDSVGGLMLHVLGTIPREGQEVRVDGVVLKAEKVQRRRILSVLVTRVALEAAPAAEG